MGGCEWCLCVSTADPRYTPCWDLSQTGEKPAGAPHVTVGASFISTSVLSPSSPWESWGEVCGQRTAWWSADVWCNPVCELLPHSSRQINMLTPHEHQWQLEISFHFFSMIFKFNSLPQDDGVTCEVWRVTPRSPEKTSIIPLWPDGLRGQWQPITRFFMVICWWLRPHHQPLTCVPVWSHDHCLIRC